MSGPNTLAQAIAVAGRGFPVMRVRGGGKEAMDSGWPELATTDVLALQLWPAGDNYGYTLAGLLVVDIDQHTDGVDGEASWKDLAAQLRIDPEPETWTVSTPTGGKHIVYRLPDGVSVTTATGFRPGLDIRSGAGHYVVGPGSVRPDGAYVLVDDTDPIQAPAALLGTLAAPSSPNGASSPPGMLPQPQLGVAVSGPIPNGRRHQDMVAYAGRLASLTTLNLEEQRRLLWLRWQEAEQPTGDPYPWEKAERALHEFRTKDAAKPADSPFTLTAAELAQQHLTPPQMVVDPILPVGLTLFIGAPKSGKSWMMLGQGVAVSTAGGKVFGHYLAHHGDVLYLALEDAPWRLSHRLEVLGSDPEQLTRLHLATRWPRLDEGGDDQLDQWLDAHPDTRMVAVDVLTRVRPVPKRADNLSAYEQDYRAVEALKAIADRHQVALWVSHHDRKAKAEDWLDVASGSKGLTGAADAVHVLRRKRNDSTGVLHVTGRDVEDAEIRLDFDDGRWQARDANKDAQPSTRQRLLDLLSKGAHTPASAAHVLGENSNRVRQAMFRLHSKGQIERGENGLYTVRAGGSGDPK